jgi:NIPSNAP protein
MNRLVEIRSYRLKPGAGARFHQLVDTRSIPMAVQWGMDVVAYGPSLHNADEYFLIRAFDSRQHLHASQEAFYSSAAWREGPREAIVELIETQIDAVMWLSAEAVQALRESHESGRAAVSPL